MSLMCKTCIFPALFSFYIVRCAASNGDKMVVCDLVDSLGQAPGLT